MRNMIWMHADSYLRFQSYFLLVEFLSLAVRAWLVLIYVKLSLFHYLFRWHGWNFILWFTWCLVQWFSVNSAFWLIYLLRILPFLVILLPYWRNSLSLKRINFCQVFYYLSNFLNVAGLPFIMLRFDCFCCRGLPASSLEHWWPPYYICMHGKHDLATFHPSSSRGTFYDLSFSLSAFFIIIVIMYQLMFMVFTFFCFRFLGKQQKRVGLLMMAALFEGASIGPMIDLAIEIDPRYAPIFSKFGSWELSV